ncbi:inositol monophosphatase family protein [Roseisalinus antarcticus]|uniref:Histidinol-phosphatase n=1 Tax=Roseisalinus antarcticus TaxID=254357 RepID=A0A1Y5RQE8_9RHOB|nr:inositol monophosphatase [Roseisalinus antarcticus]SLN20234.1 Histidinol-phosphatase [Roseisalinus antarcticus]
MTLSQSEETALIGLVRDVARAEILPRFRRLEPTEIRAKSRADDLVTAADIAAERALTEGVARILPAAQVVGEEAVAADAGVLDRVGAAGRVVIIDPVDGTWNFAKGLAVFGVILAVVEDGETVFGLLYDPVFDDWVVARKGAGAFLGRAGAAPVPLSLGHAVPLAEAQGFVPLFLYPEAERAGIAAAMLDVGRGGSLRCSCHEYRQIVTGGADFGLNALLNVWDHAAGALAVTEAGGCAALEDGRTYRPEMREGRLAVASSGSLWRALTDRFGRA